MPYEQIPYAREQGIYLGLTGNLFGLNRELENAIREIESLVREPGFWEPRKAQPPAHARIIVCRQLYAGVRPGYIL